MKTVTKRILAVMLSICVIFAGLNTVDVSAASKKAPKKITLNAKSATVYVKGTYKLYVKSVSPSNTEKAVKWSTSNKKVATISSKGIVKGIKAGKVTITATSTKSKKVVAKCTVTVVNPTIKLNKSKYTIETVGAKRQVALAATVKGPSNTVTWSSSNKKVATVDKKGVVTGLKSGTVTITASANGKKATCKITVKVPSIAINKSSASIYSAGNGSTVTLTAYEKGKAKKATWTSSNSSVASVNSNGVVTGKKAGTATITAKIGKAKVTCKVTVKTQSLTLDKSSVSFYVGQSSTIKATVYGASKTVTWSTSNSKVVTVSKTGVITAKAVGKATITAKANGLTKTCTVNVKASTLSLDKTSVTLNVGDTTTIKATVAGASKNVTWIPSNPKVATVSKTGVVTAIGEGTATITATANGVSKECKVTVNAVPIPVNPMKTITLSKNENYTAEYDGSVGFKEFNKVINMNTVKEYKDLYFDRVVNFVSKNIDDLFTAWQKVADRTKTVGDYTIQVARVDDITKNITLTSPSRTEVIQVRVKQQFGKTNVFDVTITRGTDKATLTGLKFSVEGKNYKVEWTKLGAAYTLLAANDGTYAELKLNSSTVAKFVESTTSYAITYDTDLLNDLSVAISDIYCADTYKAGDILNKTIFSPTK